MENTTGDAPSEWYREEEHIGYDVDGRRISRRRWNDSIENLLHTIDDPSYWRKVFDEKEDREISFLVLTCVFVFLVVSVLKLQCESCLNF